MSHCLQLLVFALVGVCFVIERSRTCWSALYTNDSVAFLCNVASSVYCSVLCHGLCCSSAGKPSSSKQAPHLPWLICPWQMMRSTLLTNISPDVTWSGNLLSKRSLNVSKHLTHSPNPTDSSASECCAMPCTIRVQYRCDWFGNSSQTLKSTR